MVGERGAALEAIAQDVIGAFDTASGPDPVFVPQVSPAALAEVEAVAVVFGWTTRIVRTAEAALLLVRSGSGGEIAPLMRSMIEHTVALAWLVDQRGVAFQALVRQRSEQARRMKEAQEVGWDLGEEAGRHLQQAIDIETDADSRYVDYLLHTRSQASKYGHGSMYQAWLSETWSSHPTIASAQPYYTVKDGRRIDLYRSTEVDPDDATGRVVVVLLAALGIYNEANPGVLGDRLGEWEQSCRAAFDLDREAE